MTTATNTATMNHMTREELVLTAIYSLVYRAARTEYPYAVEFVPVGHDGYVAISCWANNPELVHFARSEKSCYASDDRDYLTLSGALFDVIGEYVCSYCFSEEPYTPMGYAVRLTDAHKALLSIIKRYGK